MKTISQKLLFWPTIIYVAAKRLYIENFAYQASALAFVTLLSFVPLISVIVYFVSFFPLFSNFLVITQSYIYTNFIPSSSLVVEQYLNQFVLQATRLPLLSIAFFVVTGALLMLTIENALNAASKVINKIRDLHTLFLSWLVMLLLPLFIGFSAFLSGYLISFIALNSVSNFLLHFIYFFINSIIFSVLYTIVPNKRIKWKDGFIGGLVAALLFELIKKAFVFYISHLTSYEAIYGTLSAIPTFLIWIYLSWCIILYGALVIQAKEEQEKRISS